MSPAPASHSSRPRPPLLPIGEIVGMLAARVASLVAELLPGGMRDGHEWRCGSLGGERGQSLGVHLVGDKAGVWADFSTGETGDALDLVAQVLFRGDKAEALKWARGWLGLDGTDPAALAQTRREAAVRAAADDAAAADEAKRARDNALRIWLTGAERLAGTPVALYLAGRGIDLGLLGNVPGGRQPRALRYHASLWHAGSGRHWPAMVAIVTDGAGQPVAVHRTWLAQASTGSVNKAPVDTAKMVLGRFRGASIKIWRGASGKPLARMPDGEPVVLTEGIEDALTVALACPDMRVLAAVSLGNLGTVALPAQAGPVIVCADNDPGEAAQAGFARALDRLGERHDVRVVRSPVGKDVNDWLRS